MAGALRDFGGHKADAIWASRAAIEPRCLALPYRAPADRR
jgi:hypothetical protein